MATAQRVAEAQMYSPPFQVSGSTVTTTTGTYGNGAGLDEPGADYTSVTIGMGTTIDATVPYGGSYPNTQFLVHTSTSSFTNAGNITLTASGNYEVPVWLDQGATALFATNSGSISATEPAGTQINDVLINSTTGDVHFSNTGSLYAGQAGAQEVLSINSTSGNLTIDNALGGTIEGGGYGRPVEAITGGAGTIDFSNEGMISNAGNLTVHLATGNGDIQASNSGTIQGGSYGIYADGQGGATISNTGNVSGSASALYADVGGDVLISNTASGTATGGIYGSSQNGTTTVTNAGMITGGNSGLAGAGTSVSVTNTGTITNSGYYGLLAYQTAATGTTSVNNSGSITGTVSGIYVYSTSNTPSMVVNSGTIDATGTGIMLGTPGTVINSGPLTGGVDAINVPTGSSVILRGDSTTPNAVVNGVIVGGGSTASTSTLEFNENVPGSQYGADRAELDAEIATYAALMGGTGTFTFGGLTFNVSNFDYNGGVIDALIGRLYANTSGFYSLGSTLDRLNAQNAPPLLNALNNLSDDQVAGALAELSPQTLEIFRNVAFDNNTFANSQVNNHLTNLRDGQTGFDASQLTVKDQTMDPLLDAVRSRLLAYDPKSAPGLRTDAGPLSDVIDPIIGSTETRDTKDVVVTKPTARWSSFIAGDVILADLNAQSPNFQNSDYTTGSITAGVDYRLDEHFTVGVLLAYAHTAADLDNRGSSATVDSYSPGLYASYVNRGWYANAMASYTRNAYTEDRLIDIPGIAGDNHGATSGNQGAINLTGGREFRKGPFTFGPVGSLQYVRLSIDSINEQGPTALEIDRQSQDSLRTLLGLEGRYATKVATPAGMVILTPHISASWQHEYLDNSQGITSQFNGIGGGSFSVQTDPPERDSAFIDVGVDVGINQNVVLFLDYSAQAGQDDFFAQSASGGAKIGF